MLNNNIRQFIASVDWVNSDRTTIDGIKQGITYSICLNLGYGYEWSRTTYVIVSLSNVISDEGGTSSTLSTN